MQRLLRLGVVLTADAAVVLGLGHPATADPTPQVSVSDGRLAPGGLRVVLTGRYVCGPFSPDSDSVVDLTVVQGMGTTAYGYLYLTVDSVGGQFVRGRAQVSGSGYACDRGTGGGCVFGPTGVRIR